MCVVWTVIFNESDQQVVHIVQFNLRQVKVPIIEIHSCPITLSVPSSVPSLPPIWSVVLRQWPAQVSVMLPTDANIHCGDTRLEVVVHYPHRANGTLNALHQTNCHDVSSFSSFLLLSV